MGLLMGAFLARCGFTRGEGVFEVEFFDSTIAGTDTAPIHFSAGVANAAALVFFDRSLEVLERRVLHGVESSLHLG